jgi:hypothetical protein
MRINGQYFGISAKPTNRLAFKYMKLTRKFPELFQVFTNFNRKYFLPQYTSCGKHFRLLG